MAAEEYLARDFKFSASADNVTYTEVKGINKWGWMQDAKEADITDFDDRGWENTMNAGMKEGLKLDGRRLLDAATGSADPGQKILFSAGRKTGPAGYCWIKVEPRDVALTGTILGKVRVKTGETGGGNDDPLAAGWELAFKGKPTLTGLFDPDS
jgi:hypothetical protein